MSARVSGDKGAPNKINLFGTNQAGVDVFAQMVHGTTIALTVGFVSMGIAAAIGITLGALAGYFGGIVDMVISRLIEEQYHRESVLIPNGAVPVKPQSETSELERLGLQRQLARAEFLVRTRTMRLNP